ncbi:unnamed protein product [Phytomonas sp. Hart1]|nr:unnamed protein product [Phytomonas sp. Hart1]|eukprot:CCW66378.1 unnamed protein product [Phytomonas sp. isolate Hart1]
MLHTGAAQVSDFAAQQQATPLKPKNTHRLYRIFRKPKSTVAVRRWRGGKGADGESDSCVGCVSKQAIMRLVGGLTESERQRAEAKLEPFSILHEELAKRAARFGVLVDPGVVDSAVNGPTMIVDEETLRHREMRFKSTEQVEMDLAMQRRQERFGAAPTGNTLGAPIELKLSDKDTKALEARARRFAN